MAILLVSCACILCSAAYAAPVTLEITVKDENGVAIDSFRWLLEENTMRHFDPTSPPPDTESIALNFHTSYVPVVAEGETDTGTATYVIDDTKRYALTVLSKVAGYTIGGAAVRSDTVDTGTPGAWGIEVVLYTNEALVPAQFSIFVFEDNHPVNNSPNLPAESGLQGFKVYVEDAGGRYGATAGQTISDAFGNPIGTTYNPDGSVLQMGDGSVYTDANGFALIKNMGPGKYGIRCVPPGGTDWQQTTTIEGTPTIDAWVPVGGGPLLVEFGTPSTHIFMGFVRPTYDDTVLSRFGPCPADVSSTGESSGVIDGADLDVFSQDFGKTGGVFPADTDGDGDVDGLDLNVVTAAYGTVCPPGGSTITGRIANMHLDRPPLFQATAPGAPFPGAWVGLNDSSGKCVYAQPADNQDTAEFSIEGVPPGSYQLVMWDEALDLIISFLTVTVPDGGGDVDLGTISVSDWFSHLWNYVYYDDNNNGVPDPGETPIPGQNINLRFRDGTIYQAAATDSSGFANFDEIFPFFHWQVAEVDFARLNATGFRVVVDEGGPVDTANQAHPIYGRVTPQTQIFDGGGMDRTEEGVVLTQAFQVYAGQTNVLLWGKQAYTGGNNGGISGIVFYATTRAEDDPRLAAAEPWEPGIPDVQVNLYRDGDVDNPPYGWATGGAKGLEDIDSNGNGVYDAPDGQIDDLDLSGGVTLADVDNAPFGWETGGAMGLEDKDWNTNGVFDLGDAVQIAHTDNWNASLPENCPGLEGDPYLPPGLNPGDCFDGLRSWNQVRPGVFDGGYAFGGIELGTYIVAVDWAPPGYSHLMPESKNVDFCDEYAPVPGAIPPPCAGDDYTVPVDAELELFPGVPCALAGQTVKMCNRKQVTVKSTLNAAADIYLKTTVPISAHFVGNINNDLGGEGDPINPSFGEKKSIPFVPVSMRDHTGREVARIYGDQFSKYNGLVPSTYSQNLPWQSGMSPAIYSVCINDAGPIIQEDPMNPGTFELVVDPFYRMEFTQSCYDFQFAPGTTTYLDTPVLPTSAWAARNEFPVDCAPPDGTPVIDYVSGPDVQSDGFGGAYVPAGGGALIFTSRGTESVPNPLYDGDGTPPQMIDRDFGFSDTEGTVTLNGAPLTVNPGDWTNSQITAQVPGAGVSTGQLVVTRGDNGVSTRIGVTVHVGATGTVRHVLPPTAVDATPIQDAIDAAAPGDLILIHQGAYFEKVIMYKPVLLQGSGARGAIINAFNTPANKLQLWRDKIDALVASGDIDLLPGQDTPFSPFPNTGLFPTEQGAGITVLGPDISLSQPNEFGGANAALIDGLGITGGDRGGAIFVASYAPGIEISNNRLYGNWGTYGGGVRSGHPVTAFAFAAPVDSQNDGLSVRYNEIFKNGALNAGMAGNEGGGGGIAIYTGTDNYVISDCFVCANFSAGSAGGILHEGLSEGGVIANNQVVFNHQFHQTIGEQAGGGISIGGSSPAAGELTPGSGSVDVYANLIQGNYAGAGDGGGIRLYYVNGQDVQASPVTPSAWHRVNIYNNMIVNNVTGKAGAVSFQDSPGARLFNNQITYNDSTATEGTVLNPPDLNGVASSTPQPAGILSRVHSAGLASIIATAVGGGASGPEYAAFSNPLLLNNILWKNRSFRWQLDPASMAPNGELVLTTPPWNDLDVLGAPAGSMLDPRYCFMTDTTGYHASNVDGDPGAGAPGDGDDPFVSAYFNDSVATPNLPDRVFDTAAALDEGGNFIDIAFQPLYVTGDYHITSGSLPHNSGNAASLPFAVPEDYDGQGRQNGTIDIGADEFY
ncbi:MAG: hypothetical protein HY788_03490 [Deltaproteobacteria bacterium]|nr:hypothetical protein [Deltaproteobacteria bacterium]